MYSEGILRALHSFDAAPFPLLPSVRVALIQQLVVAFSSGQSPLLQHHEWWRQFEWIRTFPTASLQLQAIRLVKDFEPSTLHQFLSLLVPR